MSKTTPPFSRHFKHGESGQAFVEFAFIAMMLAVMLFGLIDFGRFIYEREVLVNLSREGSNLASRGTDLSNTVDAVLSSANPLNLNASGAGVIVTAVTKDSSGLLISGQLAGGGASTAWSKVGAGVGKPATLSGISSNLPPQNQTLYVTEVFYSYTPITPIGQLLQIAFSPQNPVTNYDVAFFTGL